MKKLCLLLIVLTSISLAYSQEVTDNDEQTPASAVESQDVAAEKTAAESDATVIADKPEAAADGGASEVAGTPEDVAGEPEDASADTPEDIAGEPEEAEIIEVNVEVIGVMDAPGAEEPVEVAPVDVAEADDEAVPAEDVEAPATEVVAVVPAYILFPAYRADFKGLDTALALQNAKVFTSIAQLLLDNPNARLLLDGQANPVLGTPQEETDILKPLSGNRAEAAADFLVNNYGIKRGRLITAGSGGSNLLANDASEHYLNRRVDYFVIAK
ncbi:MAG: hypothetical protein LBS97_05940 [Treponema sp.]|jgi:outer membrane protein OmpA-like peptidoglycan-associated protein|nr:hypothetical protein [Treponema sp.]